MWPRIVNAGLGLWLMAAPAVLDYGGAVRTTDRIVGPLTASVAVIAIWEVIRAVRWANVALGVWLLLAPWLLGYGALPALNSSLIGLIVAALALIRGPLRQRIGGGLSSVWSPQFSTSDPASAADENGPRRTAR